jgi:hypothetical protein
MFHELFEKSPLLALPLFSLLLFGAIFAAVLVYVARLRSVELDARRMIPLRDEDDHE